MFVLNTDSQNTKLLSGLAGIAIERSHAKLNNNIISGRLSSVL